MGVDFEKPEYNDVPSKMYSQESLSHLNELFEVLLFNTESYCRMDYDVITRKEKREGMMSLSLHRRRF